MHSVFDAAATVIHGQPGAVGVSLIPIDLGGDSAPHLDGWRTKMAKRKRKLTPDERERIRAELAEVQRDVRALIETLRVKIAAKRSA